LRASSNSGSNNSNTALGRPIVAWLVRVSANAHSISIKLLYHIYITLCNILRNKSNNEIKRILSTAACNRAYYWAREDGDIHAPAGFSTLDVLSALGSIGAKAVDFPIIRKAIDFVFTYYQDEGQFRYGLKSSKLPCITARILAALGRLGYHDDRLESCYKNLLETQWSDGGWRCATVKLGISPETDASNPGTTLYALDAFLYPENSPKEKKSLERGVAFLLGHWDTRRPLGPCEFGIGTNFMKTEFPMIRYNLLYYCYVLSKYDSARRDRRYKEAVQVLRQKVQDGGLVNENPHKKWQDYDFAKKGEVSGPMTALVADVLG
jgi:hypothetical protein